ncbi:interferon lambda-3-like [Chrysemys picta bellii]|uniref:interferon lambda-3-like n=1 Tax=Chrysemys picta bellii TaxID=8478 RepID=UPI00046C116B|nr:interferon lambda-3-like [Chrysemys picta bellii]
MSRTLLVSALLLALVDAFAEGAPNEMLRDPAANCSARIFRRKLDKLSECQNLLVLEKKVDVTIRVIQNLSDPELVRNASKPLEILASIQEDLRSCIQLKGLGGDPAAQQPVLARWLRNAYAGKSEGSARCLEEAMIFNLFRLLNDLQNVAHKFNESCH